MDERHEAPKNPIRDEEGTVVSAEDWRGQRFSVGERVMYCIGAGRGQMMAIGKVVEIEATVETRTAGRVTEEGETPTRMLDWHNPPMGWLEWDYPMDVVRVKVLTEGTSGHWNNRERTRPAWVNPMNITALKGELA